MGNKSQNMRIDDCKIKKCEKQQSVGDGHISSFMHPSRFHCRTVIKRLFKIMVHEHCFPKLANSQ